MALRRVLALVVLALLALPLGAAPQKKIVFLAGTKSHGPGDHEYEKGLRLLARCLTSAPNLSGYRTEVHLYGWPEDPGTLDDADAIVVYADGSDHNVQDHPLLAEDRLETIGRQMRRGCGLVLLHYATFVPVARGGPEYLDWAGGFFDYESGDGTNRWLSRIQTVAATVTPASPAHPISRGLAPFALRDEFYYRMRFRPSDPRRSAILTVPLPGEREPQTVAWAVERADGGRGFAFTGGHFHQNWQNASVRTMALNAIVWAARGEVPAGGVASRVPEGIDAIRTLILTGRHHPAHDWRATTAALQEALARDPRSQTTVGEDPEALATDDLSRFDRIVLNYCNWESPSLSAAGRARLLRFVRSGGGLVLVHFANGAWRDWPDYFGGLARRVWVDGKANHDAYGPLTVRVARPEHRLARGLPAEFVTTDELYCSQVGEKPVDPLLTARSKVTGRDEPLAFVYAEGKGRVFQTLLGHDAQAIRNPVHAELIQRASAWTAGREVLPAPIVLPSATAPPTADSRFGQALDARRGFVAAPGRTEYQEPPLTVECWTRLFGKAGYNLLVANSAKESARHWELYTEAGSGRFAVYLPGVSPANVFADTDLTDGKWHHVALVYLPGRVQLFVDGRRAADQPVGAPHATPAIGPLWIGAYPPGGLGCDGLVDDVRISKAARAIGEAPAAPLAADADTIGLWSLDTPVGGRYADASPQRNDARAGGAAETPEGLPAFEPAPWPALDRRGPVDWPAVGNDPGGMRYSPLKQIDRSNVTTLKVAWTYRTGDARPGTTIECTPLAVGGVLYLTTVKQRVVALDAATGKPLWRFDPGSTGVNRGVAYWSDGRAGGKRRILFGTGSGHLYSLDARTGQPDPAFGAGGRVDLRLGLGRDLSRLNYAVTSPPALFEDRVIVPVLNAEGQPGAPGDIRAFDVRTGRALWRFRTVPEPGEFGNDTWGEDGWRERSGTNPWSGFTVDTKRGIVFCGTGSPASDFYGADRPGANLFGNCTLALDARTGRRLWHFQQVHHDLWDHDNPCPPALGTIRWKGKPRDIVAQPTKTGFIYLFDRVTGAPLFPVDEKPAPPSAIPGERAYPTQPVPSAPPPLSRQGFTEADITDRTPEAAAFVREQLKALKWGKPWIPPSLEGTVVAPGFHGGANWSGASLDPATGILYINTNDVPYLSTLRRNAAGGYDFQGYTYFNDDEGFPAMKPPWGWLTAVDLSKGRFVWRVPFGYYPELEARGQKGLGAQTFGGTIVTAGGLVFLAGSPDEKLHAYDKATGKLLWSAPLPAGGYATPCTYQVNGRQYVVIAAGGGGKLGTKSDDQYIAFALP